MGSDDERQQAWEIRPLDSYEVEVVGDVLGLARLYQGDGFYLVAWQEGAPIGQLHLALSDPPELQDVAVRPSHRRRGVATALAAAAEGAARARGFQAMHLEVSADDLAAQSFYRSCGYVDAGLPARRVTGTVMLRTGAIEVDDRLITWTKRLTPATPIEK
jgi:ribosomal protein S18 acetylase RimI-like enzyme